MWRLATWTSVAPLSRALSAYVFQTSAGPVSRALSASAWTGAPAAVQWPAGNKWLVLQWMFWLLCQKLQSRRPQRWCGFTNDVSCSLLKFHTRKWTGSKWQLSYRASRTEAHPGNDLHRTSWVGSSVWTLWKGERIFVTMQWSFDRYSTSSLHVCRQHTLDFSSVLIESNHNFNWFKFSLTVRWLH